MHRRLISALAGGTLALTFVASTAGTAAGAGHQQQTGHLQGARQLATTKAHAPSPAAAAKIAASLRALKAARGKVAHDHARLASSLRDEAGLPSASMGRAALRDHSGRVVVDIDTRSADAVAAAVRAVGGRVLVSAAGLVEAAVPASTLAGLSDSTAVQSVREPVRAVLDTTNQGVAETNSDVWTAAGKNGTGVTVAIVDGGFQGYAAAETAGDLPPAGNVVTQDFCTASGSSFEGDAHGTAVAEIVHQMAPAAHLQLVCVNTDADFVSAASWVTSHGAKIANASLGFPAAGRGDGTGALGNAVKASRQAGVLWTISSGNQGLTHRTFDWRDADHDDTAEVTTACNFGACTHDAAVIDEYEFIPVNVANAATVLYTLQWDAWPTTNQDFDLIVYDDATLGRVGTGGEDAQTGAQAPVEGVQWTNNSGASRWYDLVIVKFSASTAPRFDLTGFPGGATVMDSRYLTGGSITEPATSPSVMSVGAHCVADGTLQPYSSGGPTIDGRVAPSISGPDAVSSAVSEFGPATDCNSGFQGTSAAAPHVAGAAAQLLSANSALDASQLQEVLESKADPAGPAGTDNSFGSGLLRLGTTVSTPATPTPTKFTPLATPARILDTRTTIGGHQGALAPNATFALKVAGTGTTAGVPADAKAVVLNLTVAGPTAGGFLSAYPSGTSSVVSNLNFVAGDIRSNNATVTVGTSDQKIVLKNGSTGSTQVIVDVVGYYGPSGSYGYAPITPVRKLDTRTATGGHQHVFAPKETFNLTVTGGTVPPDATGVALNLTAVSPTTSGWLSVYPTGGTVPATSSLNFKAGQVVPNLVVSKVGTGGKVAIQSGATGTLNAVVDVVGYYAASKVEAPGGFVALRAPLRVLDTRSGLSRKGALGAGGSLALPVGNLWGVPHTATGAVINTTVAAPTTSSFLTVWPTGTTQPNASNLNYVKNQVVANNVMTRLGTSGQVSMFNKFGSTQVIGDLAGYFAPLP